MTRAHRPDTRKTGLSRVRFLHDLKFEPKAYASVAAFLGFLPLLAGMYTFSRPQISWAYCSMVLSEENLPTLATFIIAMRAHLFVSL